MFFGHNVGSTLHKSLCQDINIVYKVNHSLIDNFLSNLLDSDRYFVFVEKDKGIRPDNFITLNNIANPPVFFDTWIGDTVLESKIATMHLKGAINVPSPISIDLQKPHKHIVHLCYDAQTEQFLQEIGVATHMIPASLPPSFINTSVDEKQKSIDIGILQNSYDVEKLNVILQTLKNSIPDYNIQIIQDSQQNDMVVDQLKQTKILITLDYVSSIDIMYATNFCNTLISTAPQATSIPNKVLACPTLDSLLEETTKIMSDYHNKFNLLHIEKNRLLLNNPFSISQQKLHDLLHHISEKI